MLEICNVKMGRHRLTLWLSKRWRKPTFHRYHHAEGYAGTFMGCAGPVVYMGQDLDRPTIAERG